MRFSFFLKVAIVAALVILFDRLFRDDFAGARIGCLAAAWLVGVVVARQDVRKNPSAWIGIGAAAVFAVSLVDDPGLLAWVMFWCSLSAAALLPRVVRFDDAWHWGARLALHAITGVAKPVTDLSRIAKRRGDTDPHAIAVTLALPVIGGALFLILFSAANPLIAQAFSAICLPSLWQLLVWTFVVFCAWPSLRPHAAVMRLAARLPDPEPSLPGTSLPSVLMALALFNLIFAIQNGLDVAFLWSGGALPAGMTQTDYVHRGAYPLIATALIAGAMALAMFRPSSASERNVWARRLVALWVAQNLVLVASSALRTIDYIETSMLTIWRIAALLWMALVALGLVLICWRILRSRSARWLINWNALAAALVLTICCFLDLGAIAADWNVRVASPEKVDLCYLSQLGDSALLPLIALEQRPMSAATRDRVRYVRERVLTDLAARQRSSTNWTPRGSRRLARSQAMLGPNPARPISVEASTWRNCNGTIGRPPVMQVRP